MTYLRSFVSISALAVVAACASARGGTSTLPEPSGSLAPATVGTSGPSAGAANSRVANGSDVSCAECDAIPIPTEITQAVETRIAKLKARGGDCSRYATVLETSYRSGQITLRPFMWRVGAHLASGEAKPNGDMMLAREIDSLNVGLRTVDDVVQSMEHEAVHITFDLASGAEASEVKADQYVRACKA